VAVTASRRERLLAQRSPNLFGERNTAAGATSEGRALRERAAALRRERRRIADGGALPFAFPTHFAHVHARGGFKLIVGNPPWVRLHNIPPADRSALRSRFSVFSHAAWEPATGAARAHFGAQADLAALFLERGVTLLAAAVAGGGTIALLLPVKLWRSLSGGGARRLLAREVSIRRVEDWTDAPCAFDAAVYPSVIVASRRAESERSDAVFAVRRRTLDLEWTAERGSLSLDAGDDASPWLVLPVEVRAAFERIRRSGVPLGAGALGLATLGVKCGCNDAFIVTDKGGDPFASIEADGRAGVVERAMLRPLLRGDALQPWRVPPSPTSIIWTHSAGGPLRALPSGAGRWLAPWRRRLRARTDARDSAAWWELFRTEAADSERTRVVWSDFGRAPRAAVLAAGDPTVPLNSCYVLPCADPADALALAALLNGPIAAAWLNAIAEPARGGWHRYLAWTVMQLPLPRDWTRARDVLAPLARRALLDDPPAEEEMLLAACRAYRLRRDDVAPLIAWCR
jgi:hypothetical protein